MFARYWHPSETVGLNIKGLIYHGDFHLTPCIIRIDDNEWYHDWLFSMHLCLNMVKQSLLAPKILYTFLLVSKVYIIICVILEGP